MPRCRDAEIAMSRFNVGHGKVAIISSHAWSPILLMLLSRRWGAALALFATFPAANAQTSAPLWELGLGAAAVRLPHYRGSDQAHQWLLPFPYFVYRGEFFKADRDGTRALLFNSDRLTLDLSAAATAPTRSRDNAARQGMPDLAPTLELGPNLNITLARGPAWKLDLRVPVRAAVAMQRQPEFLGWSASPNINLDWRFGDSGGAAGAGGDGARWNLGLLAGPVFGDGRNHAYFYGVLPQYASATRPSYRAGGGLAGWGATVAVSRRSADTWLGWYVRADSLSGARFADSPLVKTRHNVSAGVAVSWVLKTSDTRVRVGGNLND